MDTAVFDDKTAPEHASAAAEAIRAINHLTFDDNSLPYPSDAWRLISNLASTAYWFSQALRQTGQLIEGKHARGGIGIDYGTEYAGDPGAAVRDSLAGLHDSEHATALLADGLERAAEPPAYAHYVDVAVEASEHLS